MIIKSKSDTKYVIMKKWESDDIYLDKYDCETKDISKAMFFNEYIEARDYKENIDVAYLYTVNEVLVQYIISDY